jgi:hypothetical protein
MYYGDQIFCERWIISSVKSGINYAEIPYDALIFPKRRLRGLGGARSLDHGIITTFHTCLNNRGISWIKVDPMVKTVFN